MAVGGVIGLWIIAIIFTIIYFVVLNFSVEKTVECTSFMGQLGMLFSQDTAQKCKMVGLMVAFAPLVYVGVKVMWIVAIIATVIYGIYAIILSLKNHQEEEIDSDNLVRCCSGCNHDLTKEELENHHCNNCGDTICTCHCHLSNEVSCEYCADWHRP